MGHGVRRIDEGHLLHRIGARGARAVEDAAAHCAQGYVTDRRHRALARAAEVERRGAVGAEREDVGDDGGSHMGRQSPSHARQARCGLDEHAGGLLGVRDGADGRPGVLHDAVVRHGDLQALVGNARKVGADP